MLREEFFLPAFFIQSMSLSLRIAFFVGSVTLCAAIIHGLSYGRGCFIFKSPRIYECSSSLVQMDDASSTLICSAEKEERHECANFVA